jgi:integrase
MIAVGRITDWPESWAVECRQFIEIVEKKYKLARDGNLDISYAQIFSCAIQYHYLLLPPPCSNHLSGVLPLALLPEEVQMRRVGIRPRRDQQGTENSIDVLSPLMDASVDQLWGTYSKSRSNKTVVGALQQAFKGNDIERIRLADYLQKNSLRLDLNGISKLVLQSGCPINALLTLWVIHLFEWGSVRLRNPTAGTIRRYVVAIVEILHDMLVEVGISPTQISQEKWEEFFATLLATVDGNDVGKNAAKSFHRFLVIHLGIDPVPANWGGGSEDAMPHANIIWPHEKGLAFKLIPHFTSDLRLQGMLYSMLAMGCGNPVRIGDLPGLTAGCISRNEGRLRLDIFHRHGQHKGKSGAATRPLDYLGLEYSEYIRSWLDYREMDAEFGEDVLIFGDPNRPGKCYRLGLCLRLLNQILKAATGDPSASFHMLRHTCICNEIVEDLLIADIPTSIARSKEIAARAGQKNDLTTYSSYFHIPEIVIRRWIDANLSEISKSPMVAGLWLNSGANTLTVAKGRSCGDEDFLEDRLRQAASTYWPEKRSTNDEIDLSLIKCIPCLDAESGFQKTLHILNAVVAGLGLQVIAARNDTTPEHVVDICRVVIKSANAALSQDMRKRVAATANSDFLLKSAKSLIDEVFCYFPIVERVLEGPLQYLRTAVQPDDAMRAAVLSWEEAKQGKYTDLTDSSLVAPLASFLVGAGVPAQNFYICLALRKEVSDVIAAKRLTDSDVVSAQSVFEKLANTSLQVVRVTHAKGRPNLYLMFSRNRIIQGKLPSSAESRTNRIHALMLALSVWIELFKTREQKNES